MTAEARCLHLVEKVRAAAGDPTAAYLIRSRLRRAILSCARMVASQYGARSPDVPGVFVAPCGASEIDEQIVSSCNRIHGIALELCQPSESFDLRWSQGWAKLQDEFDRLELAIAKRRGPFRVAQ